MVEKIFRKRLAGSFVSSLQGSMVSLRSVLSGSILLVSTIAHGEIFHPPTANRALFDKGGEERFFVPTVGKTWESGTFGCVRSDGWQIHEGLDIRCLQHDRHGEPTDDVMATADGTVVYVNTRPAYSNYGNYVVLRHQVEGIDIYSLYAHLRESRVKVGQVVKAGEVIGIMGRTANTHEGISKDRAHVHFELNLIVNDRYAAWHSKYLGDERNDHGNWNGRNLNGIDPRKILLQQQQQGANFSLVHFIQSETELCRVFVRDTDFPWLRHYAPLIKANPLARQKMFSAVGYEIALDFNGVPIEMIPRSAGEVKGGGKFILLSVNEAEQKRNPGRKLVSRKGSRWELTSHGQDLLSLATF